MKKAYLLILCLLVVFILAGCTSMKTYTYEEKRVDQDLTRGNRGVVLGNVPTDVPDRKLTRTMFGVDVELPPTDEYEARKRTLEAGPAEEKGEVVIEEPIITFTVPPLPPGAPAEAPVEKIEQVYQPEAKTYTIEKGDTLQKISRKFYGTTKKWAKILEANKDTIKHSSRIYPGQVIKIPPQEAVAEQTEEEYK